MIYPKFLAKNDLIGITALSSGCSDSVLEMKEAINNLEKEFKVICTNNVWGNYIVSSSKGERINELKRLLKEDIKLLQIARGGDYLYEVLSDIPYNEIVNRKLLVQGYSDPTSLLYILTTKYDLATIYGLNGKSYSGNLLPYQLNNLEILKGNLITQKPFDKEATSLNGNFKSKGIIIGGCLDVLRNIVGTKYDATKEFLKRYQDYSIIWYFDIFNMKPIDVYLTLLQLRDASWFKNSDTFLIGKVLIPERGVMSYPEAYKKALWGNIYYDTNIGHVKPMFTIVNGSFAEIECVDNEITIKQEILK